jgi:hypothetical protein
MLVLRRNFSPCCSCNLSKGNIPPCSAITAASFLIAYAVTIISLSEFSPQMIINCVIANREYDPVFIHFTVLSPNFFINFRLTKCYKLNLHKLTNYNLMNKPLCNKDNNAGTFAIKFAVKYWIKDTLITTPTISISSRDIFF